MKTHSAGAFTAELFADIKAAAPPDGYAITDLSPEDGGQAIMSAVNQGINGHLSACFMPALGDSYKWTQPPHLGPRRQAHISAPSLPELIRRLMESGDDTAERLAADILYALEIELI